MKYIRKALGVIVLIIAFYYFVTVLVAQRQIFSEIDDFITLSAILPISFFTAAVIASGFFWGKIISTFLNKKIKNVEAVRVHLLSWILKYLPGQAGSLLNKLNWAINNKYDKIAVSSSFVYENLLLLTSSFILSVPILLLLDSQVYDLLFILIISFLIVILIYFYRSNKSTLFSHISSLVKKFFNKDLNEKYFLNSSAFIKYNTFYLIPRLLNGIGFALILTFIIPLTPFYFIVSASIYILAGVVGLAAIFVPSGIGVREAVIVFFVSMFADQEIAVLVSILSRAYSLISDLIIMVIYLIIQTFFK